jgi:glycerol-3-phosphate acyltransferase PlsY
MPAMSYILTAFAAYLLGSIPTGYLAARAKGVDIRTVGSGNIGATNAMRVLGKPTGIAVLVLDALKGFAAVALIINFYPELNEWLPGIYPVEPMAYPETRLNYGILAGVSAVLGHNYTCWLGFKGGKGIATTAGVYFALAPMAVSIALALWIVLFVMTRYVSIASIGAAIALPTAVWLTEKSLLLGIVTTALGVMAILKHKGNIQRLRAGTESRINFKKKDDSK